MAELVPVTALVDEVDAILSYMSIADANAVNNAYITVRNVIDTRPPPLTAKVIDALVIRARPNIITPGTWGKKRRRFARLVSGLTHSTAYTKTSDAAERFIQLLETSGSYHHFDIATKRDLCRQPLECEIETLVNVYCDEGLLVEDPLGVAELVKFVELYCAQESVRARLHARIETAVAELTKK